MGDDQPEEGLIGRGVGGMAGGALGSTAGKALGTMAGGPIGGAIGGVAGDLIGTSIGAEMGDDDDEKNETYDNTPNDPTDTNEFDAEEFAHHENPPGAAKGRGNMNNPRAVPTMEEIEQNLFSDYKKFIGEAEEEETDEGIMDKAKAFGKKVLDKVGHGDDEDMIKDLQKKAGVPQTGKKPETK
jgi:hypothetical protein